MNNSQQYSFRLLLELRRKGTEDGYSLVVVLASIILLGTLLVTTALVSKVDTSSTKASGSSNSGFYAAEAGLGLKATKIRQTFEGFNLPNDGDNDPNTFNFANNWEDCVDNDNNNDGGGDFKCETDLVINDQKIVTFLKDITRGVPIPTQLSDGAFSGLNALEYRYDLMSVALGCGTGQFKLDNSQLSCPEGSESPTSILGLRFKSGLIPVFQFAAFYDTDLAFTIPPTMTINGRVHSNSDIYLNAGGGSSTLAITGKVTTPGTLYRGEKTTSGDCRTTVSIFDGSSQRNLNCDNSSRKKYNQSDLTDWTGYIFTQSDKNRLDLPKASDFSMPPRSALSNSTEREKYKYWEKADLRVVLKLDNNNNPTGIQIVNPNGTEDTIAMAGLNSCAPVSTVLLAKGNGDNNYERDDVVLRVQSADSFKERNDAISQVGDRIIIGNDIDSNVIQSKNNDTDTITLRRQLGHSYQPTTVASANNVVRKAILSTSDTFYNYREKNGFPSTNADGSLTNADGSPGTNAGRFIRMLDVDVKELINCIHTNTNINGNSLMGGKRLDDNTEGGLVWFFGVDGPNSHNDINSDDSNINKPNNYGIRLYNAAELDATDTNAFNIKGLTVVSDQAVYTQGNYNSINKIPAAIIADSYNVLSTAWRNDDENSRLYNSSNLQDTTIDTRTKVTKLGTGSNFGSDIRDANHTTINMALYTGQDIMGGENGDISQDGGDSTNSGGVNNFPRFHEDWDGSKICGSQTTPGRCTLTYSGSMVSFGKAKRVNGTWCGSYYDSFADCNIYTPPVRDWKYDTTFDTPETLPPMTPNAVYLVQELFERDFTYTSSKLNTFSVASLLSDWKPSTNLAMTGKKSNFSTHFML